MYLPMHTYVQFTFLNLRLYSCNAYVKFKTIENRTPKYSYHFSHQFTLQNRPNILIIMINITKLNSEVERQIFSD